MWEKLTPADIERARHQLAVERGATLSRHAAELKVLDARRDQIEHFEHLVAAFAEKYLAAEAPASEPMPPSDEQPTEQATAETSEPAEAPRDEPSPVLQVEQPISPNFGIPLRRLVGR